MVERTVQTVQLLTVEGPHGLRYQLVGPDGRVHLATAGVSKWDWETVERHMRALHDHRTPQEEHWRRLHAVVEEQGVDSETGGAAYAELIEAGQD